MRVCGDRFIFDHIKYFVFRMTWFVYDFNAMCSSRERSFDCFPLYDGFDEWTSTRKIERLSPFFVYDRKLPDIPWLVSVIRYSNRRWKRFIVVVVLWQAEIIHVWNCMCDKDNREGQANTSIHWRIWPLWHRFIDTKIGMLNFSSAQNAKPFTKSKRKLNIDTLNVDHQKRP